MHTQRTAHTVALLPNPYADSPIDAYRFEIGALAASHGVEPPDRPHPAYADGYLAFCDWADASGYWAD